MKNNPPTIICTKWGTAYNADYVNLLHRAVRDNLNQPHRFVCITDDANGLDTEIDARPLPDMKLEPQYITHGGWPKIGVFKPDILGASGRALYIDLDVVIVNEIDTLLDAKGDFLIIREWPRFNDRIRGRAGNAGNSAVFAFDIGAQNQIYENFMRDQQAAFAAHRIEQRFVSAQARGLNYWNPNWCLSFKRHMLRPLPLPPRQTPPPSAHIITFHGRPKPDELVNGGFWGKPPRCGFGSVKFVRDYWHKYKLAAK